MNNVLDMLAKTGYEASSIGNDVLPCTLRTESGPVGFLLEDLTVKLLSEHEAERGKLESVITFAEENQGLEMVNEGEYLQSRYRNTLFTAAFDFETGKPYYNIYSEDKDKNLILLGSGEDKATAARDFASRSGLVVGEIPEPARETDRIGKFVESIKNRGFQLRENREEAHRAYDISDKNGKVVGFIGKNNRVTITTENVGIKRTLSNAYIETNPDSVLLSSFFEKLKERLKEIGLALKVIFTANGRHYAIRNQRQQEIATVNEQHTVAYTDQATTDEKAKIDALVDEIRRENQERQTPKKEMEREMNENPERSTVSAEKEVPAFTPDEMQHLAEAVLADETMTASLFGLILSNQDFISRLNSDLAQKLQLLSAAPDVSAQAEKQKQSVQDVNRPESPMQTHLEEQKVSPIQKVDHDRQLSPAEMKINEEFYKDLDYLQTLDGFNPEKQQALRTEMEARFGTVDPKEFQAFLEQGKFSRADSLADKLKTSQRIAEVRNADRASEQAKNQEKERS